jgi:hypothetical protein
MTKITALTLSLFFLANIFAPNLGNFSNLDCDDFVTLVEKQPILQYFNTISELPIKILNTFFYNEGLLAKTTKQLPQKSKNKKASNVSYEFVIFNKSSKGIRNFLTLNSFEAKSFASTNFGLNYSFVLMVLILLIYSRLKHFVLPINLRFLTPALLARGSIQISAIQDMLTQKSPVSFDWAFLFNWGHLAN